MNALLMLGLLVGGGLLLAKRARAGAGAGGELVTDEMPVSLAGQPTRTTERAGEFSFEVLTWPKQADGMIYKFVKFADQPGNAGVTFAEQESPFRRTLVHAFGPTDVTDKIRAIWFVEG